MINTQTLNFINSVNAMFQKKLNLEHGISSFTRYPKIITIILRCPVLGKQNKDNNNPVIVYSVAESTLENKSKIYLNELKYIINLHLNHCPGCKRLTDADFKETHHLIQIKNTDTDEWETGFIGECGVLNTIEGFADEKEKDLLRTTHFENNPECRASGFIRNGEPLADIWKHL